MQNCSKPFFWKISKPKISRIPKVRLSTFLLVGVSKASLTLWNQKKNTQKFVILIHKFFGLPWQGSQITANKVLWLKHLSSVQLVERWVSRQPFQQWIPILSPWLVKSTFSAIVPYWHEANTKGNPNLKNRNLKAEERFYADLRGLTGIHLNLSLIIFAFYKGHIA